MSIFSKIKDVLFGKKFITIGKDKKDEGHSGATTAVPRPEAPQSSVAPTPAIVPSAPQPAPVAPAPSEPVDIEAVLNAQAKAAGQPLNWRTSIVDLMKLCEIDPSLENRRELADELGYTGDKSDTATMNIWLHKQVLAKLEESGGKVPSSLKD